MLSAREQVHFDAGFVAESGNNRHMAGWIQPIDRGQVHVRVLFERLHEEFGVPVRLTFGNQHANLLADRPEKDGPFIVCSVRFFRLGQDAKGVALLAGDGRFYTG